LTQVVSLIFNLLGLLSEPETSLMAILKAQITALWLSYRLGMMRKELAPTDI